MYEQSLWLHDILYPSMTQGPSMGSVFVSTINFHSFVKILTISILKKKKKKPTVMQSLTTSKTYINWMEGLLFSFRKEFRSTTFLYSFSNWLL